VIAFSVIERAPGAANGPLPGVAWRTCVREITFVEPGAPAAGDPRALHDETAYAHLLEVICGLDSPMFGETEVMHQFKQFAEGLVQGPWRELSQMLLADARAVRARHLIGLGSRSYGSAVRRHVRDCHRVAVIGTGILAREVVPFLADGSRRVDLWGRRDSFDTDLPLVTYHRLGERRAFDDAAALVVAAPVTSLDIVGLGSRYCEVTLLIDLRAEGVQDPPPPLAPIVTLAEVFDEVQRAERSVDGRVAAAKVDIRRHARAFATRAKLNPSGWHDLCA
jgi:glutamyl-tRNA reductase